MRQLVVAAAVTASLGWLAYAVLAPQDAQSPTPGAHAPAQQLAAGVRPAQELTPTHGASATERAASPAPSLASPAAEPARHATPADRAPQAAREAAPAGRVRRAPVSPEEPYGVTKLRATLQGRPFEPTLAQVADRTERLERKLAQRERADQVRRALGFEADDPAARELEALLGAGPGLFESVRAEDDPRAELSRLLAR